MGKTSYGCSSSQRTMEQSQMTTAATSKKATWKACAFYLLPETKRRLDHYLLRLKLDDLDSTVDQSDIVHEALLLWLDAKENNGFNAAKGASDKNELADLVELVVSLKDDVEELQKWRKLQISPKEKWVDDLRMEIKRKCGKGLIIDAVGKTKLNPNGKCRLSKIATDRTRTSVILPHDWLPQNAELILNDAIHVHESLLAGMNIKDALKCRWREA